MRMVVAGIETGKEGHGRLVKECFRRAEGRCLPAVVGKVRAAVDANDVSGHHAALLHELADKGIVTADTNVVRREYAEANPDVVAKFTELQLKANEIINTDSAKASEEIASVLEISKDDAADQITQFTYLDADKEIEQLDKEFAATLKSTADFLVEQKSITSAPELSEFEKRVTSEFVKKAAGK